MAVAGLAMHLHLAHGLAQDECLRLIPERRLRQHLCKCTNALSGADAHHTRDAGLDALANCKCSMS